METDIAALLDSYRDRAWRVATAESCTGGMLAAVLTETPGSSTVFERGWVVYTNDAKSEELGVSPNIILRHGAVSAEAAEALAAGALARARADIAVSITGIAGPDGGTPAKPVGLVYIGLARKGGVCRSEAHRFAGDRAAVREQAVKRALALLKEAAA